MTFLYLHRAPLSPHCRRMSYRKQLLITPVRASCGFSKTTEPSVSPQGSKIRPRLRPALLVPTLSVPKELQTTP